jgi:hypothetical protein
MKKKKKLWEQKLISERLLSKSPKKKNLSPTATTGKLCEKI